MTHPSLSGVIPPFFRRAPLWALDYPGALDLSEEGRHPLARWNGEDFEGYCERLREIKRNDPGYFTRELKTRTQIKPGGLILCGPMADLGPRYLQAVLEQQTWHFAGLLPLEPVYRWRCEYAWGVKSRGDVRSCSGPYMASSWGFCCECWEAIPLALQRRIATTGHRGGHWDGKTKAQGSGWAFYDARQAAVDALARQRRLEQPPAPPAEEGALPW